MKFLLMGLFTGKCLSCSHFVDPSFCVFFRRNTSFGSIHLHEPWIDRGGWEDEATKKKNMSDLNFVIDSYAVSFRSNRKPSPSASIYVRGTEKSDYVILDFVDSHAEVLPAYRENPNRIRAYYHKDRLPEVMDLLRNEGPLTCATDTRSELFGNVFIYSGPEPIGEGEI